MRVKTSIYYFSKLEYFSKASVFFLAVGLGRGHFKVSCQTKIETKIEKKIENKKKTLKIRKNSKELEREKLLKLSKHKKIQFTFRQRLRMSKIV